MNEEVEQNMMSEIMENMMNQFLSSMSPKEKKQLMKQMMPKMIEKMMEGLTTEDRQELMGSMMPVMMSQMHECEGDEVSTLKQKTSSGEARTQSLCVPGMESTRDSKPWDNCPCRKLCEKAFEGKKADIP